jgi:hypothetical protein
MTQIWVDPEGFITLSFLTVLQDDDDKASFYNHSGWSYFNNN